MSLPKMSWSKCPNSNFLNTCRIFGTSSGYKVRGALLYIIWYENCEKQPPQKALCLCSTSNIPSAPMLVWHLNCNYRILSKIFGHFCLSSSKHSAFQPLWALKETKHTSRCNFATRGQLYISTFCSCPQRGINFIAFLHNGSTTCNFGSRIL